MSKIIKNMWGKSDKKAKQQNETSVSNQVQQELDPRPFDVDFKNLGKYDNEELSEFIWKYEQFIRDLRKKYQDMNEEYPALKQKITLGDKERKHLTEELEQFKLQCQNLKGFIEQNKISGSNYQKSLSNSGAKPQETLQQNAINQKSNVDLDALLTQFINPAKILDLPAVTELQNSFKAVSEDIQELLRGFERMEKVDFQEEGHHPKLSNGDENDQEEGEKIEPKQPEQFYLLEDKIRQKMIKLTKTVQRTMENSSASFEGFLNRIQERHNQLILELKADLDPILRNSGNFSVNPRTSKSSSPDLGASDVKILVASLEKQNKELRNICNEYERNVKGLETEKKKLAEGKRDGDSKANELKKQTDEQSKVIEDLIAQNHLLENHNAEMEDQISTLNRNLAEVKQKLERAEKDLKSSKESEDTLAVKLVKASENDDRKGQEMNNHIAKIEALNMTVSDLEVSNTKLKEEIKIVREELKNACGGNELQQPENQNHVEVADLRLAANSLREEIEKLQKAISVKDSKLLELENKLIQERLKAEQIKRDVIRADEALREAKASLNDQINTNHDGLKTIEHLENELAETRKKYRDCKKNLKKNETQLTKVQNQLQEEQVQRAKLEQSISEHSTKLDDTSGTQRLTDNELTVHSLSIEVRDLTEKVELLATENAELIEENKKLNKLYSEGKKELELLKEKREAGLKEIKRLNTIIDSSKTARSQLSQRVAMTEDDDSGQIKIISVIKKSLEALYKQFIVSIQYESSTEASPEMASKSMRSTVQGFIPPDNVVRFEKKLNDLILYVREYLENVNSFPS